MKKKKILWVIIAVVLLAAAAVLLLFWQQENKKQEVQQSLAAIEAKAGETVVYATLYTVRGNEITYYTDTTEENAKPVTTLIPVGTPVTTKLGTVTTFSRLAAGDGVALVVNDDDGEIEAVYIVE